MPRTQLACLRAFDTRPSQPLYDFCPSQVGRSGAVSIRLSERATDLRPMLFVHNRMVCQVVHTKWG